VNTDIFFFFWKFIVVHAPVVDVDATARGLSQARVRMWWGCRQRATVAGFIGGDPLR
jgi:hypothetical protein